MKPQAWLTLVRTPHLWARIQILQSMKTLLKLHFLYAAIESGLLDALRSPTTKAELVKKLGVQRPDLLEALLKVGVSLGELSAKRGTYSIRGRYARALL